MNTHLTDELMHLSTILSALCKKRWQIVILADSINSLITNTGTTFIHFIHLFQEHKQYMEQYIERLSE